MATISPSKLIKPEHVCVLLIGFNRPELLKKRVKELYKSSASSIYISIDGGLESHTREMAEFKTYAINLLGNQIINLHHHENNLGLVKHITETISKIFITFEYIIVVEDDVILSNNFYCNMISGLNLQKMLNLNGVVSGGSTIYNKNKKNKWKYVATPGIWGWACSAAIWNGVNFDLAKVDLKSELEKSNTWRKLTKFEKKYWIGKFTKVQSDPFYSWEYQFMYHLFKNNIVSISPIFSMTGNEGFGDARATHTSEGKPRRIDKINAKLNNSLILRLSRFSSLHNLFRVETWYYRKKISIATFIKSFAENSYKAP
jgi:hypothetical protein